MSNRPGYYSPDEINFIFSRLDPQDVERFYQSYQLWTLRQQIIGLQSQITTLQQQIAENNQHMQQSHPSAISLAALARLQSHDVTNIELLDQMLARGEDWLDRTMQHLTYCEQFDFIRNNYTEWCQHALDGAYDWIDSMQNSTSLSEEAHPAVTYATTTNDPLEGVTEEILLQKLMSEEEAFMLESTLKRPAVPAQTEEHAQLNESTLSTQEEIILSEFSDIPDSSHVPIVQSLEVAQTEQPPAPGEAILTGKAAPSDPFLATNEQPTEPEYIEPSSVPEEIIPAGETTTSNPSLTFNEPAIDLEQTEYPPAQGEFVPTEVTAPSDPPLATNEQATEVEQLIDHSPVPQEPIPAGVDNAHGPPPTTEEQTAPSRQVEVDMVSAELDEPSLAGDGDILSSLEIPSPTPNDSSSRTEESPLTEANSSWHQMASQGSTEQSNDEPQRSPRPPKKRGFLRLLFAVFFGR